jgi:hypothetical protein
MRALALLAVCAALASAAQEQKPASPAQLAAAAKCATPQMLEDLWEASVIEASSELPEEYQKGFRAVMAKSFKPERIRPAVVEWLARHFTAPELDAFSRFLSTPSGRAAFRKFAAYHALLKPAIEGEIKHAAAQTGDIR